MQRQHRSWHAILGAVLFFMAVTSSPALAQRRPVTLPASTSRPSTLPSSPYVTVVKRVQVTKPLAISSDGSRVGALEMGQDGAWVSIVGEQRAVAGSTTAPSAKFGTIITSSIAFSPDGRHFAFERAGQFQAQIVLDGIGGRIYREIAPESMLFSPDSQHLAYLATTNDNRAVTVLDGVEQPVEFGGLVGIRFSGDSKHLACAIHPPTKSPYLVVVDGKPWPARFDGMDRKSLGISSDGSTVAAVVSVGSAAPAPIPTNTAAVVVNGERGKSHYAVEQGTLRVSPDGKRVAYVASPPMGAGRQVVENGVEGKAYAMWAGHISFSPDSKHIAYQADAGTPPEPRYVAVIDGVEHPGGTGNILFSPDSQRTAYTVAHNDRVSVCIDGKESPQYKSVTFLQFSPDSRHVAYIADGDPEPKSTSYDDMRDQEFPVGPVQVARLVVDGSEIAIPLAGRLWRLDFVAPATLNAVVLAKGEVQQVVIKPPLSTDVSP